MCCARLPLLNESVVCLRLSCFLAVLQCLKSHDFEKTADHTSRFGGASSKYATDMDGTKQAVLMCAHCSALCSALRSDMNLHHHPTDHRHHLFTIAGT